MSAQVTKISNVHSTISEFYFPHTYLVEQNGKFKVLLNLNDDAWWWQDTLVECSYNLPNMAIGPVGYAPYRGISYLHCLGRQFKWAHSIIWIEKNMQVLVLLKMNLLLNDFVLYQNYPNPFNPATNIEYKILKGSEIRFNVINILGEKVFEQNFGYQSAGNYKIDFDGSSLSSGIYLYSIITEENRLSRKMILVK